MTFRVNVRDGTNAGTRRVKPLPMWRCGCNIDSTRYSCGDCGQRRPDPEPSRPPAFFIGTDLSIHH